MRSVTSIIWIKFATGQTIGIMKYTQHTLDKMEKILERSLLSFLSVDRHTSQSQPIMGTPPLVPVPKNVMVSGGVIILYVS